MPNFFASGLPWPAGYLGADPYVSAESGGDLFTLLVGIEIKQAAPASRAAIEQGGFSIGFTVDRPHLSIVIFDEHILMSSTIVWDAEQSRTVARQVRAVRTRRLVVATVRFGVIATLMEKPSKAGFWRGYGKLLRDPQPNQDLEQETANLIWPLSRDVRPVYGIDGQWRLVGRRPDDLRPRTSLSSMRRKDEP